MVSRFNNALLRFRDRLIENAGDGVEVKRDGQTLFTLDAVPAITRVDLLNDKGMKSTVTIVDFVYPAASGWEPKRGDRVVWRDASYIVKPVGAEWWKYDDAEKVFIRVHTQEENPAG